MKTTLVAFGTLLSAFGITHLSTQSAFAQSRPGQKCGDMNNDGSYNFLDGLALMKHANGDKSVKIDPRIADVNLDGKVDKEDARLVMNMSVGAETCLACPANRNACKSNRTPNQNNRRNGRMRGFL